MNKSSLPPVKIIAALIDPLNEKGREYITLLNVSPREMNITDWILRDDDRRAIPPQVQCGCSIPAGATKVIQIPKNTNSVLRTIELLDHYGNRIHSVSFKKNQVEQGWTITFH